MAKVFKITDKEYEPGHEPLVCSLVSCENPCTGRQRKYCSPECRTKHFNILNGRIKNQEHKLSCVHCKKKFKAINKQGRPSLFCSKACSREHRYEELKGVYEPLDGWAGGPRGLTKVESSIKKKESYVLGDGRFSVDDYPIDPDIFAIAEANHEQYVLDRNEYEARVVIDGLTIFQEEYDKHHEISYASEQAKKREANLTEDQKLGIAIQSKQYQKENKERIRAKQKANYYANPEKYRKKHREYYKNRCLKKKISGS